MVQLKTTAPQVNFTTGVMRGAQFKRYQTATVHLDIIVHERLVTRITSPLTKHAKG